MKPKTDTTVINDKLYPLVIQQYQKNITKVKNCFGRFIQARQEYLYDIAPYSRMYFGQEDINDFFDSIDIKQNDVADIIKDTYYSAIDNFNPSCVKDEFVCCLLCIIRFCHLKNQNKELEMYTAYLSFSGKFYTSIHYGSFPKAQPSEYKHIMLYVINNKLSGRYDIKREGNLFKAVRSIGLTWHDTYKSKFKDFSDEDFVYLAQQLRNRIASFIHNIAEVYYEVYNDKDSYMTYDSDNLSEDGYRLADNDSLKMERVLEGAMQTFTMNAVNYKWCASASDVNVKAFEVKEIMTSIFNDPDNIPQVRELIRCIMSIFFSQSKNKDVRDLEFLRISITPKPNSKDPYELRKRKIVEEWLSENSDRYRKRRNRLATASSYQKCVITYISLGIQASNK